MPPETISTLSKRVFSGGTPSTQIESYWDGNIPWLSSGETSNRYISKTESHITQEGVDNSSTKLAKKGTIVIASAGQGSTRGQTSFLLIDTYINQSVIAIEIDQSKANPQFVFYNISTRYEELRSISDGTSSRGSLTTKLIGELIVDLPDRQTQDRIVSIIQAIDDKILVNQSINDNLQAIAYSKYNHLKRSCVDQVSLSDIAEVCYGKDHKSLGDGSIPVYGSGGIMRFVERPLYDGKESVLIPRKGTLNNVMFVSTPFWSVDTMFYTKMKCQTAGKYLYFYLRDLDLASMNSGSAVPSMTTEILNDIQVPFPDKAALDDFDEELQSLFDMMKINEDQINHLSSIRDVLLPKLMSGEIDVSTLEIPN